MNPEVQAPNLTTNSNRACSTFLSDTCSHTMGQKGGFWQPTCHNDSEHQAEHMLTDQKPPPTTWRAIAQVTCMGVATPWATTSMSQAVVSEITFTNQARNTSRHKRLPGDCTRRAAPIACLGWDLLYAKAVLDHAGFKTNGYSTTQTISHHLQLFASQPSPVFAITLAC